MINRSLPLLPTASVLRRALGLTVLLAGLAAGLAAAPADPPASGLVVGRATNQATGEVLGGAQVSVEDTAATVYASLDGTYSLAVPAGTHVLEVQFAGLATAHIPFTVGPGATVTVDAVLSSPIYQMQKVVVPGLEETDAMAVQEQRAMPNVAEVTATDAFGVPSPNPGDLLMKLPEVSEDITGATVRTIYIRGLPANFSNLMIDGNMMASSQGTSTGRQFQIEQYDTSQLQEVQVIFEPTPDMQDDQIGGVVNLITNHVYDLPNQVQITVATNWIDSEDPSYPSHVNPGEGDFNVLFNHTYSVFGGTNNLGLEFNLNENHQAATAQQELGALGLYSSVSGMMYPGTDSNTSGGPIQTAVGARDVEYVHPWMYSGGFDLDYKFNSGATFSLRTTYNDQKYDQYFWGFYAEVPNNFATSFLPGSTPDSEQTTATANAFSVVGNLTKRSVNYSINPEFVDTLFGGSATLDVAGMYSFANIWYPGYDEEFMEDRGTAFSLDRVGAPEFNPLVTQTAGPSWSNAASYQPDENLKIGWGAPDTMMQGHADYTQHLPTPFPSFIKTGVLYSNETRQGYENESLETAFTGSTADGMAPYEGRQISMNGYNLPFYNVPYTGAAGDSVGLYTESASNAFSSEVTTLENMARYQEDLSNAYVEGSATFGKLTLLAGIRAEHTVVEGQQYDYQPGKTAANASLTPAQNAALAAQEFGAWGSDTSHYTNYLPGVFLTYEPLNSLLIKGSYSVTVTRPPTNDILPGVQLNPGASSLVVENPDIQPYTSQNWDLNVSKYFEPIGLFEAGIFVKQIKNYIANEIGTVGGGEFPAVDAEYGSQYPGWLVTTDVNLGTARFRGCYFGYQQTFTQLPGLLRGIGLYANCTFLETQGNYGGAVFYENLAGFTPFSANYGISYDHGPLQAELLFNYRGNYLVAGSVLNGPNSYSQPGRTLATLSADYRFNRNWDVFATVNNLTNEYTSEQVYDGVPYGAYLQGVAITTGFRFTYK